MFKGMKLATKLAVVIGAILAAVFAVLIVVTAMLSSSAITSAVSGELTATAQANGHQVQQIFDMASSASQSMQNYLESAYETAEEDPSSMLVPTDPAAMEMCRSAIFDNVLTSLNYDVEVFLSETARNTTAYSEDIYGMGAMFEPYCFQDDIRAYSFYVDNAGVDKDIQPYGS